METKTETSEGFGGFEARLRGFESIIKQAMQQHTNLTLNFNFYEGASIGQHIERTDTSNVWMGNGEKRIMDNTYSDEHVARAIEAICGEGKPLDSKQKWVAVYWYLRWECNFPAKGSEFCERIERLPFSKKLEPECDYNNIRKLVTCQLMEQDARFIDKVKPSNTDKVLFEQCRPIVIALARELGKRIASQL